MSEKIYCKDCRFYSDTLGTCHKFPPQPMFDIHNKSMGHPYVCDNDWCGMAERREEAEPEITVSGKIEAGDAVCICKYGEPEDLKAENNRLRGLIAEVREFLIEGAVPGRFHLKQECIREIYTIGRLEDQNGTEAGHC